MNRFFTAVSTIALTVLVSACAGTQNSAQNGGAENAGKMVAVTEARDPNQVTCRSIVKTGTRIGSKVCKTNRAWDQAKQDSRDAVENIQRGSAMGTSREGGG